MEQKQKKHIYPMIFAGFALFITFLVQLQYKKNLQNYETELLMPLNSSIYLAESFVSSDMIVTELTDKVYKMRQNVSELYKIPLHKTKFTTILQFDPSLGIQRLQGSLQGSYLLIFDQLSCQCEFGFCPEIQQLDLFFEAISEKFDQPYRSQQKKLTFQVRKSQLVGEFQFEDSSAQFEIVDYFLKIKPVFDQKEYKQTCKLKINVEADYREFNGNLTEVKQGDIIQKGDILISKPQIGSFSHISLKSSQPKKPSDIEYHQSKAAIVLCVLILIFTIINFMCNFKEVDIFDDV